MKKLVLFLTIIVLPALVITLPVLAKEPLACEDIYTVQAGDWLSKIAEKYLDDPLAFEAILTAANAQPDDVFTNIDSPDAIEPGWVLCIDTDPLVAEGLAVEMLANTTYKSEWTQSGTASLVDGEYREPAAPGSATEIVVKLTDYVAYGDLNGQPAAAVVLVTNPGGSGTFYDLAVVVNRNGQPFNVATVTLGDRVIIHDVSIIDNEIVVDMLQPGPNDPLCCPTRWVVNRYTWLDEKLAETSSEHIETITDKGGLTPNLVNFDPNGLASYIEGGIVPAEPYDNSATLDLAGHPDYVAFLFDDEPRLAIYPVAGYRAIWDTAGDSRVTVQVNALKQLLAQQVSVQDMPPLPLPVLPPLAGGNDLAVQINYIDFANGSGVRYVGRSVSDIGPVTNSQLNYYFQGLTADGNYYVSFIFPVWAANWPDTLDDVSAKDRRQAENDNEAYLNRTASALNQLNADTDWLPPLSMLDGMVQSISINPK